MTTKRWPRSTNWPVIGTRKDIEKLRNFYYQADDQITLFMRQNGIPFLRISLGMVFFWFGFLKFFPGLSPADQIATETISKLTFGIIQPNLAIIILAIWETLIGIGLLSGKFLRITLLLLFTQMIGTMTPLVLFPTETFTRFPFVPTLEGQYIIKNLTRLRLRPTRCT